MTNRPTPAPAGPDRRATRKHVAMLVSGGLEHAGGIGRWAGHTAHAWREQRLDPPLEIVDTRGFGNGVVAFVAFGRALGRLFTLHCQGRLGSIHANLSVRGSTVRKYLVAVLARVLGVPLVLHLHGSGYSGFYEALPGWAKRRVQALFAQAVHVIVLGQVWADWVEEVLSVPRDKITVLYNGVPPPAPMPRRPAVDRVDHIVLLGRIGARKGVSELLAALSSEQLQRRQWRATLAGDGEVDAYARDSAARGLARRVEFAGWLDSTRAAQLIADADILVLPSRAENFPLSVIEALANRVAVVTTPVGATPELLTDGESVRFVPVGDTAALASALCSLLDDPAGRARIAAAGHAVFSRHLNIDVLAPRLADLHRRLLAQAGPCAR